MSQAAPIQTNADPRPSLIAARTWGDAPEMAAVSVRPSRLLRMALRSGLYAAVIVVLVFLGAAAGRLSLARTAVQPGVLPGEFEVHGALLLGLPVAADKQTVECLGEMAAATHDRVRIVMLTGSRDSRELAEAELRRRGVPLESVQMLAVDINFPWTRDYGPQMLKKFNGEVAFVDGLYSEPCNAVPSFLAEWLGVPCDSVPLTFEGGNLLSNGSGLLVTTTDFTVRNKQEHGYSMSRIERLVRSRLGATQLVVLEPLAGESTQHADMFATFAAPDVIVVGEFSSADDPVNAEVLNRNAAQLRGRPTSSGPLQVVRIPMPPPRDGQFRTYTNVAYVNGVLLAPRYADVSPQLNEQAMAVLHQVLPSWKIVQIDSDALSRLGGGPHCATMLLYGVDGSILDLAPSF